MYTCYCIRIYIMSNRIVAAAVAPTQRVQSKMYMWLFTMANAFHTRTQTRSHQHIRMKPHIQTSRQAQIQVLCEKGWVSYYVRVWRNKKLAHTATIQTLNYQISFDQATNSESVYINFLMCFCVCAAYPFWTKPLLNRNFSVFNLSKKINTHSDHKATQPKKKTRDISETSINKQTT